MSEPKEDPLIIIHYFLCEPKGWPLGISSRIGIRPTQRVSELQDAIGRSKPTLSAIHTSTTPTPSTYLNFQNGPTPILDGRYATERNALALPIEVYHPAFAHFRALSLSRDSDWDSTTRDRELDVDEDVVALTVRLMDISARIVTSEEDRESAREILSEILQVPLRVQNGGGSAAVYDLDTRGTAALAIIEEKADSLGTEGDPSTQGSLAYIRHWTLPAQKALLETTSCPSFIISLAGPWLVILGAVLTSNPIVQRLTDYMWLGQSRVVDDTSTLRLARVFTALRRSVGELHQFYCSTLSNPEGPTSNDNDNARFYPYARSYIDSAGCTNHLSYTRPLGSAAPTERAAFLATTSTGQRVVVKFVERYGAEAHKVLSALNRAPALFYHGPIYPTDSLASTGCLPRKMVVMQYIEGETCEDGVSDEVRVALKESVGYLHARGLVHGDIRTPNVIVERGEGSEGGRTRMLDFDWAGREGEVRYPLRLSPGIWTGGVGDYKLILGVHDVEMLERLPAK
ncbi:hypothetical protein MD484_g4881, partial [Candolleomyces efflorescens]